MPLLKKFTTRSMNESFILTPKPTPKPRITGPKVFGVRPGSPFLFKITATGEKPLKFTALNLPSGLHLNTENGIITGTLMQAGSFNVEIIVNNSAGAANRILRIECGDKICLTPPLGWNSWYVYSLWVSQETIEAMAKAMVDSGLADHGWTYINIDDAWQGHRDKATKALRANDKFPDMKAMCDYIHSLGLKAGIYSTPWVGSYAGYVGGSAINPEMDYSTFEAPMDTRKEKNQLAGEIRELRKRWRYCSPIGFENEDTKQWADWGFDYLKYDWHPNDVPHITTMLNALTNSGRDFVYSLSNAAPFDQVEDFVNLANVWRTTGDIRDKWSSIKRIGFNQEKWQPYGDPGHWNDPDMLQIGMTATPHIDTPQSRPSRLTPDEQYTQMSLWCLLAAPLLLSCDLRKLDAFTISLLTNDEVLEINQDPLGIGAKTIRKTSFLGIFASRVLARPLEDGNLAVGLFNLGQFPATVKISWTELGISGDHLVRDLWRQQDLGTFSNLFSAKVPKHGVKLIKIMKN